MDAHIRRLLVERLQTLAGQERSSGYYERASGIYDALAVIQEVTK